MSSLQVCWGMQDSSEFEKFIQQYAPPQDIIELLEKHKELVLEIEDRAVLQEIPNFFIKVSDFRYGASRLIHRVINAERLRRCIKKHGLNKLEVVKKYIYRLTGMWVLRRGTLKRLAGKWLVLAEKVNFKQQKLQVSLQECKQLAFLAEKTLYHDWGVARAIDGGKIYSGNNWVRNERTGKLICIDTEDRSFEAGNDVNISGCRLELVLKYLAKEIIENCECSFKTRHWLRKHKRHNGKLVLGDSLNLSSEYDAPGLNFEEVKRQWVSVYNQCILEEETLRQTPPINMVGLPNE